jgi:hypothetical protein
MLGDRCMSIKSLLALGLALGLTACVLDDDGSTPGDPQPQDGDVGTNEDPPGNTVPGPGDGTCGAQIEHLGNQLKADGECIPPAP